MPYVLRLATFASAVEHTRGRVVAVESRIAATLVRNGPGGLFVYEVLRFGVKMAWACLFGALMLALLIGTFLWYPKTVALARYDFLTIAAVLIQVALLWTRLETLEEARVIAVYHLAGTIMELVKTAQGSWIYPEACLLRIGDVPLFSGFMYACVGSFMTRAWHLFDFRFERHPPLWLLAVLSAAIYLNFMLHRYTIDIRTLLAVVAVAVLAPGVIHYRVWRVHRRMPLLLAAALTAGFIWIAENIGTATATWVYAYQRKGWAMVSPHIYLCWFLLMILSYTLVVGQKGGVQPPPRTPPE
jgi:uncharacterized membrane protein YoaT (DUF817 family)